MLIKSAVILLILDFIYLNIFSAHYKKQIFDIQNSNIDFKIISAIICYIVLIFTLNYFILNTNKSRKDKIKDAFILGLVIYTVFETTNYTIFKNWNIKSVIIDSLWGGILFALTTYFVTKV